jgi:hypothetical protein
VRGVNVKESMTRNEGTGFPNGNVALHCPATKCGEDRVAKVRAEPRVLLACLWF